MDCLMDDGPLDYVESFLSPMESDERDNAGMVSDATKAMMNSFKNSHRLSYPTLSC